MYTRNSSGRSVSLLNDSTAEIRGSSRGSSTEAPYTPPDLQQTASYDSSPRSAPISPTTPTAPHDPYPPVYDYRPYMYPGTHHAPPYDCAQVYPSSSHATYGGSSRSGSYDDELAAAHAGHAAAAAPQERPAKRFPCRFRKEYGCDKTFTTSGHASRHAKIHVSEKSVQCTYPGCQKKFTRADNMKQHRETHNKDKARKAPAQAPHGRRSSHHHHHGRRSSVHRARPPPPIETHVYGPPAGAPLQSPAGAYDLGALRGPLMTARGAPPAPSPRSGLDALFIAAHHQGDV